jgi:hypothetical protein
MAKFNEWYNNLPEHTKTYLNTQAIWTDKDLVKFALIAFFVGVLIGWIL